MLKYTKTINSPKAGVRCFHLPGKRKYVIDPADGEPIIIARAGTEVVLLDDDQVVSQNGEAVAPTYSF